MPPASPARLQLNQFGADLGGRIIPNRLFFYGAYRGVKQKTSGTTNLTLPSMAMREGDFSALCRTYVGGVCAAGAGTQLYNPFTGTPFTNNQIPIEPDHAAGEDAACPTCRRRRIHPRRPAERHRQTISPPRRTISASTASITGWTACSQRKIRCIGVFHWSKGSPWYLASTAYPTNYGNQPDYGYTDSRSAPRRLTSFSPTALNEFRAAWVVHASVRTGQNTDFKPWSLFPQLPVSDNGGLPTMSMTGYTGMFYDYGKGMRSRSTTSNSATTSRKSRDATR